MAVSPQWAASLAEEVAGIYEGAELRILQQIAQALAAGVDDPWWERDVLQRLQTIRPQVLAALQKVNPQAAAAISAALEEAYAVGTLSAVRDLGTQVVPVAHQEAVTALAAATVAKTGEAMPRILRAADDVASQVVAQVLQGTVTGTTLRRDALQQALNGLARAGLRGVQVGRGEMGLADYARMAVRTGTAQAMIDGHVEALARLDVDLVTVRPGPRACEVCDDWAGRVLAVSGKPGEMVVQSFAGSGPATIRVTVDGTLDEARRAGWGHPNCRCSIAAYMPGITKRQDVTDRPEWDAKGYQAQQTQRRLERRIREAKSLEAVALTPEAQREARRRVREAQAAMRAHLDKYPFLKRQSAREQVMRVTDDLPPAARRRTPPPAPTPQDFAARNTWRNAEARDLPRSPLMDDEDVEPIVEVYKSGQYRAINGWLRTGKFEPPQVSGWEDFILEDEYEVKDAASVLRRVTRKPIESDLVLHRALDSIDFLGGGDPKALIGKSFRDKGFVSTSYGGKAIYEGGGPFEMEILAPKGTRGSLIDNDEEQEFLLQDGTSFTVVDAVVAEGKTTIRVVATQEAE